MKEIFIVSNFPMSASPHTLVALTDDLNLQTKVPLVVIYPDRWEVYRKSTKAPGMFSLETYPVRKGKFGQSIKSRRKLLQPPYAPPEANRYDIDGFTFWSFQQLDSRLIKKFITKIT